MEALRPHAAVPEGLPRATPAPSRCSSGGNTAAAIRRAATLGDGWHPINLSPDELAVGVRRYREACVAAARAPGPVVLRCMPGGRTMPDGGRWPLTGTPEETRDELAAYTEAGCDEIMLSWGGQDR